MVQKNLRWMASLLLAANLAGVTSGPVLAAPGNNNGGGPKRSRSKPPSGRGKPSSNKGSNKSDTGEKDKGPPAKAKAKVKRKRSASPALKQLTRKRRKTTRFRA